MDIKVLKNQFLKYLEIEKSPKTVENYNHYITRFLNFTGTTKMPEINNDLISRFVVRLDGLRDKNNRFLKQATKNYHLIALRSFLRYLAKKNITDFSPKEIRLARIKRPPVIFLELQELKKLLRPSRRDDLSSLRDRAIIETLISTGFRVSELCSLNRDFLDFFDSLSDAAKKVTLNYLNKRADNDLALFVRVLKRGKLGKRGLRLSPRSIQRIVKRWAIVAGIDKNVTPHTLRHTFINLKNR